MKRKKNNTETRRLAVVTGASSGIGLELSKEFAKNGFDLIIAAENKEIGKAAKQLERLGAEVSPVQADLATYEGVEELCDVIDSQERPVDALVLNAGVGVSGKFADEVDLESDLNLLHLNVISPVHLAKHVLGEMLQRGAGRVLFTSSIASSMPGPYYATYAASKAFLQSFAEAIREELKDAGISVTALLPGATETNFFKRAGMQDTRAGQSKRKDDPAQVARQGFEALMKGKDQVVAGSPLNKAQTTLARVLPDTVKAKVHGIQTKKKKKAA